MITEKELFDRLVHIESDILTHQGDIKQLKADAKYHEDENPQGITKENIALIAKAAKLEAKANYEEFREANAAVQAKYEELTDYND